MAVIKDLVLGVVFVVLSPVWTPIKVLVKLGEYAKTQSLR